MNTEFDWYRERVVWGFYENETPRFYQGKAGEHELCEPVTAKQVNTLCEETARMRKALQHISDLTYGIESIMQDYEIDSIEYFQAAHSYYYSLVTSYQAVARSAIAEVENV